MTNKEIMTNKETVMFTLPAYVWQKEYDVVVIGGGTAGTLAGIAAAREGRSVLIVERGYALGGSATRAQVTPLMSNYLPGSDNSFLDRDIRQRMVANGWADKNYRGDDGWFHPEMLKVTLEDISLEQGVELLYGAAYVDSVVENGKIVGILCETVEGLRYIKAGVFIDATANAQVAYTIGCPFESGDSKTGYNQDMSLRFAISQVDFSELHAFLNKIGIPTNPDDPYIELASLWVYGEDNPMTKLFRKGVFDGVLKEEDGAYFQAIIAPCYGGVVFLNCPEAVHQHDATSAVCITQAVLDCRQSANRIHRFLSLYVGGFSNSVIHSFAEMPGIRESRRIIGLKVLTEDDYNNRNHFIDSIAQTAYPIDIHASDNLKFFPPMETGEYVEIPYLCMVPQNITNLLVTGRCISATFIAQSAIRIQRVCRSLGEASGIAAAFACTNNDCDVTKVDGHAVRMRMIEYGGIFV